MILVDTSIWIEHLRSGHAHLTQALQQNEVSIHPFIIGELACGNLKDRNTVLALLAGLPRLPMLSENEALFFIKQRKLMGRGIGYIDVHLLAATVIATDTRLWTRDLKLFTAAKALGVAFIETH